MIVIEHVEFFKVLVIKLDIFESEIVNEKHFKTKEAAERFKLDTILNHNDLLCVVCQM